MKAKFVSTAATVGAIAIVALGAHPAGAAGAVGGGVVLIHSTGSTFTGNGAVVTAVASPGKSVSYTLEVANKGIEQAQFDLVLQVEQLGQTETLKSGSTDVTHVAESTRGYFTKALNPGTSEVLKLTVTTPGSATDTKRFFDDAVLRDTDGGFLDEVSYETEVKATKGVSAADIYTTGNTGGPVIAEPALFSSDYADQPIKPGKSAKYTVKLENDGSVSTPLRVAVSEFPPCDLDSATEFPFTVKAGSTDITAAAMAGTYTTAALAPGKSATITVLVGYPSSISSGCLDDQQAVVAFGPNAVSEANMITDLAAS